MMAMRVYCMPMTGASMMEVMLRSNPPNAAIMDAQAEAERQNPVDAYAHELRGVRVLGRCPDCLPRARAHEEGVESRAENHGDNEGDDAVCRKDGPQHVDREREVRIALHRGPPDEEGDILDDEEQTEGREHGVALEDRSRCRRRPQRVVEDAIDHITDGEEKGGADNHRKKRGDAGFGEERPGAEGPQHNELAVGYVQNPGHAVLEAEAHRNEGEYTAREQAADHYIEDAYKNHDDSSSALVSRASPQGTHMRLSCREGSSKLPSPRLKTL